MYSIKRYKADLARVSTKFREPTRRWLEEGIMPDEKILVALLTGEYSYVIRELDDDMSEILNLLDRYCDFCHGSPQLVAQYEFFKKMGKQGGESRFHLGVAS